MTTINSNQFREICNAVWHSRAAVLKGCGDLSGETALMRAVFWRLRKVGLRYTGENFGSLPPTHAYQLVVGRMLEASGRPAFDSALILKELVERYQDEVAAS